jgi:hypothetical protein
MFRSRTVQVTLLNFARRQFYKSEVFTYTLGNKRRIFQQFSLVDFLHILIADFRPATIHYLTIVHCKNELAVFPSPAGMSLIKLFLGGNNLVFSRPERVWSVTSRLGTGKWLTLFYSVCTSYILLYPL